MAVNLDALVINIIVEIIIISPVLWIAGRTTVGKKKAKFTDAIWIVMVGVISGALFGTFLTGITGSIIQFIIWLAIIRHYFDATWGQSLTITIVSIIVFVIIAVLLGLMGFALFGIYSGQGTMF
jgi:hypothetical protein